MDSRMKNALLFLSILTCLNIPSSLAQSADKASIFVTRAGPRPGLMHLFVANADGTNPKPLLANPGTDYNPAWSADGEWIVFTSERAGSAEIFRIHPDGRGLEQLTSHPAYDDQATISPDGRQIAFVTTRNDRTADLAILDIASGQTRMLTSGQGGDFRPAWSPDGNWIAFSSDRGNGLPFSHGRWEALHLVDIYLIRPDGSGLRQLTETDGFCGSPAWTPDSQEVLAYCMEAQETQDYRNNPPPEDSNSDLVSINITTGTMRPVNSEPGLKFAPKTLPNGIAYLEKGQGVNNIRYIGGGQGPQGRILTADWSPDGSQVVYQEIVPSQDPGLGIKIWTNAEGFELQLGGMQPSFDPDVGSQLVMAAGNNLVIIEPDSKENKVIFQHPELMLLGAQWTNESKSVLFSVGTFSAFYGGLHPVFMEPGDRVNGGAQVAIVNADGSGYRELTSGSDNNAFPSASPDGSQFVYRTFSEDGYGLRLYDLNTDTTTILTTGYDNFPLWSPRGDLIMFSRLLDDDNYEIFTIRPDGSDEKRLTNAVGNDAHQGWSPDGEYIVFAGSQKGFKDEFMYTLAPQPYGEIYVMRYDGTGLQQLTDNQWEEGTPAWRP